MKSIQKALVITLACALLCALAAGCTDSKGSTLGQTATPDIPQVSQEPNDGQSSSQTSADRPETAYDWAANAQDVQDKINQLSEIQKSSIVVTGKTALVGVSFTGSYAGELTQRIHDMVAAQVQSADPSIETVAVTSDQDDVQKIEELAEKLRSGTAASELEQDIDSIVRNVTTMS